MTLADDDPGVEEQAEMRGILAGFLEVFDALPAETQVVLALRTTPSWSPRWSPRSCAPASSG